MEIESPWSPCTRCLGSILSPGPQKVIDEEGGEADEAENGEANEESEADHDEAEDRVR